jgi:hypothetical protein
LARPEPGAFASGPAISPSAEDTIVVSEPLRSSRSSVLGLPLSGSPKDCAT